MNAAFYETDRAVAEYLLFHYGPPATVLPFDFGPAAALNFPIRCVTECVDLKRLPPRARALDLGCAVGRSTFELARHCVEVIGVDASQRFIECARRLLAPGAVRFACAEEGELTSSLEAVPPAGIDGTRVRFECGDAHRLGADLGVFDVVLLANLVDRLREPRRCLDQLPGLVKPGGQLVITSPYTWLPEFTPRENWLGGFVRAGRAVRTLDSLQEILAPAFNLSFRKDLPFLIREHARKFQWSVAEATGWIRQ
jgi:putative 4-mercaptohistidine N1-methyltranferase